jgi:hypothetical protein
MAPADREYHKAKVEQMLARMCPPDSLVVQSMPFGALIENGTSKAFTPAISDPVIAYGIASAIKLAAELVKD